MQKRQTDGRTNIALTHLVSALDDFASNSWFHSSFLNSNDLKWTKRSATSTRKRTFFFPFSFFLVKLLFENTSVLTGRLRRWRHPNYTFQLNNEIKNNDSETGTTDHYHLQEEQVPMQSTHTQGWKMDRFHYFLLQTFTDVTLKTDQGHGNRYERVQRKWR